MKNRLERENLEAQSKLQENIKCLKRSKKTIAALKSKISKVIENLCDSSSSDDSDDSDAELFEVISKIYFKNI